MNRLKFFIEAFAILALSLGIYTCRKDEIAKDLINEKTEIRSNGFQHNFIKGDGGIRPESDYSPTEG